MCQYRFINPSKCTILLVDFDNGRGNACAEVGHIWEICIFCSIFLCTYNFCKNSFKKFWQLLSMINIYFLSCVWLYFLDYWYSPLFSKSFSLHNYEWFEHLLFSNMLYQIFVIIFYYFINEMHFSSVHPLLICHKFLYLMSPWCRFSTSTLSMSFLIQEL